MNIAIKDVNERENGVNKERRGIDVDEKRFE